jgi:hypothetical protein
MRTADIIRVKDMGIRFILGFTLTNHKKQKGPFQAPPKGCGLKSGEFFDYGITHRITCREARVACAYI